jgi:hypothetical protein
MELVRIRFHGSMIFHSVGTSTARTWAGIVEYRDTMEPCSDKLHVDIPNVIGACDCCIYRVHVARSLAVYGSDRSDRLDSP